MQQFRGTFGWGIIFFFPPGRSRSCQRWARCKQRCSDFQDGYCDTIWTTVPFTIPSSLTIKATIQQSMQANIKANLPKNSHSQPFSMICQHAVVRLLTVPACTVYAYICAPTLSISIAGMSRKARMPPAAMAAGPMRCKREGAVGAMMTFGWLQRVNGLGAPRRSDKLGHV